MPGEESPSPVYEIDVPSIDSLLSVNVSRDFYASAFELSSVPNCIDPGADPTYYPFIWSTTSWPFRIFEVVTVLVGNRRMRCEFLDFSADSILYFKKF